MNPITCNELKHTQSIQYMAYLGVAKTKTQFIAFVTLVKCTEAKFHQFIASFDVAIALTTF